MATTVRRFASASSGRITLGLGSTGFAFGPGTVMALCLSSNLASANATVFSAGETNAASYMLQTLTTSTIALRLDGTEVHSTATVTINNWFIIGATKATGTATPRMHIYDCTAGTWTHQNASGTLANSSTPVTRAQLGATPATASFWPGDVQLAAVWNSVLNDAAFDALVSLVAVINATPSGLWVLDGTVGAGVTDETGNGANQTAITNTSEQSATIPNFDMTYPATGASAFYVTA